MEFGLHESFPIYSGGLGILAGDIMKAACDQERALVGIGILWDEGYTIQKSMKMVLRSNWFLGCIC